MKDLILLLDQLGLAGMKSQLTEITNLGNESSSSTSTGDTNTILGLLKKLLTAEYECQPP